MIAEKLQGLGLLSNNELDKWDDLKIYNVGMRRILKKLKTKKFIVQKQHLLTILNLIKSNRRKLTSEFKYGAGHKLRKETAIKKVKWDDSVSAFKSRIRTGIISNLKHKDPKEFLKDCKALCRSRIKNTLKKYEAIKVNTVFCGEFQIMTANKTLSEYKPFTTSNVPIYQVTDMNEWFDKNVINPITRDLEEFEQRESGWSLVNIINLGVNINKYTPLLGSSYIELPTQIKRRKACINVKNNDDACFAWAVTSALYPVEKNHDRVLRYPHYSKVLKLKSIQFPMTLKQIPNFENQNEVSINVFVLKKHRKNFNVVPCYLSKNKMTKHINLLMIQNQYDDDEDADVDGDNLLPIRYHYVWIKNLSRLVSSQLNKDSHKKYFCERCLHYFYSEEKLNAHYEICKQVNDCVIRMPKTGENILKFKNFKNKQKTPFIIYSDIESVLEPINSHNKYQKHIPAVVGYYFKCAYDDSLSNYRSYRGMDCMDWFTKELKRLSEEVETILLCSYEMDPLTTIEEEDFQKSSHCHICNKPFVDGEKKICDHFHLMSKSGGYRNGTNYRGPAHDYCNINYQDSHVVPVVFHNMSNYDGILIVEDVATKIGGRVELLPVTKEKYISFSKNIEDSSIKFRFIDSYRFLASSLDKLASYLSEFPNMKKRFSKVSENQFQLLKNKGVMPYDFIDSFDKFNYTQLPNIEAFYNRLEEKQCSRQMYHHAQNVWSAFNCSNLGDYVDLYMETDIMLLTDIFETFRATCLSTYNLDPGNYYTLPGYTWECMLKYTNIELELLTDIDMMMFVERGIRGGLSQCMKRRSTANNKYVPGFDPSKPEVHLLYLDINNQYGWAMSQCLPYSGFEWCDTNIDVSMILDDADNGYFLEVDLIYPEKLHDKHKDLPFCSEHRSAPNSKQSKLMSTLHDKERYVIHYRTLKQALNYGLELTKIHKVLKFKQSPWLQSYIDLNTKLRKNANNDFEKNLYKLMNNAVFGKTMENIRKHSNVKLVTKWEGRYGAEAYISKPEFHSCTVFNPNLVAIELKKMEIFFNNPLYIGMAILDLAKTTIYNFHYGYMVPQLSDNCTALYTDTDSIIYEIRNHDPYELIKRDCRKYFDTSDYPLPNVYNIPHANKKELGMMKGENSGTPMTHFVGLRSKLYTFKIAAPLEKQAKSHDDAAFEHGNIVQESNNIGLTKKAKGVKRSVLSTKITFEDYVECLENFKEISVNQNLIKSEKLELYTQTQTKIALSPYDDKRYIIPGSYNTLPWGHYSLKTSYKRKVEEIDGSCINKKKV
ncbi:uncharacterized protein LOC123302932 [Chrysoperla carnea]|uniref:uncharacterized protein LOC123302932 n=1 Tax=Chrysoperla carnea TaxID=189513 RepID=UPI001D065BBE|nr:uncharacterized protein LOC123302932 [Chrysoperla carnea]